MTHPAKLDPLYEPAKQLIVDTKEPTISLIQRHLKIGYNRALGLMDAMEGEIVTAKDESGGRRMLVGETVDCENVPYWTESTGWVWDENEIKEESGTIAFSCFSQRGTGKARNDDAVLLAGLVLQGTVQQRGTIDASKPRYFAVADGVSMGAQPRRASRQLLSLLQVQLQQVDASASLSPILTRVQQKYAALGADADLYGMASTLVGARLVGNAVTIFNVGDSRAYLLTKADNGSQAHLLSRDHSLVSDMLTDGEITIEQADNAASIMRGLSCQFIADAEFDEFRVNIVTHTLQPGERLLLCSDGLNEVLSDTEIAALFVGNSDEDLMNAYKASRRAGGTDDFSVIVLEFLWPHLSGNI